MQCNRIQKNNKYLQFCWFQSSFDSVKSVNDQISKKKKKIEAREKTNDTTNAFETEIV